MPPFLALNSLSSMIGVGYQQAFRLANFPWFDGLLPAVQQTLIFSTMKVRYVSFADIDD